MSIYKRVATLDKLIFVSVVKLSNSLVIGIWTYYIKLDTRLRDLEWAGFEPVF